MINLSKILYILISILLALCTYLVIKYISSNMPVNMLEITVSEARFQSFGLIYIALDRGFFQKQNLKVNLRKFSLGKDALDDVIAGNSDLATVFDVPFVRQVNNGKDIRIISSLHTSKVSTAIVGLKEKNVSIASDLRYKTIGVVKGTNSELLLHSILSTYNIPYNQVNIVYSDALGLEKMLRDKEIDAVSLFNPNLYNIQKTMSNEINTIYLPSYVETSVLVARSETITTKKKEITSFLKALVEAEKFYKTNPEKSMVAISKFLPYTSKSAVADLWGAYDLGLTLDNVLVGLLNKQSINIGEIENTTYQPRVFKDYIFTEYLKSIAEEKVTIF